MRVASDYETRSCLWEGRSSSVYRADDVRRGQSVVLKVLNDQYPRPEVTAALRHEYQLMSRMNGAGVCKVLAFMKDQHRSLMVLEDFGGTSLAALRLTGELTWSEFIDLAIAAARAIGALHQKDVVHKHINPAHILFNRSTGEVKLTDLGGSTTLNREEPEIGSGIAAGIALAYTSPEQSGRMNCGLDYRTDWYSLGVVLYELLTEQVPFTASDPLELVHSHIARSPRPPSVVRSEVPETLSRIVCKLLEKNAERRYQSEIGLIADLEQARELLEAGSTDTFVLGTHDVSPYPSPPSATYGQVDSFRVLSAGFERSAQVETAAQLVLVSGPPGVGKTTLVRGLLRGVTEQRGLFLEGKCEGRGRQEPYLGLTRALDQLCRQILTFQEPDFLRWRDHLQDAVNPNGQALTAIVRSLKDIIGEQPPLAPLDGPDAEARFRAVLESFIRTVCTLTGPVVLFVDDLQWADASTLELLHHTIVGSGIGGLLIVGACRDDTEYEQRLRSQLIEPVQASGAAVERVRLRNLDQEQVAQMTADSLGESPNSVAPLAELLHEKTSGNPMFTIELLRALHQHKLLWLSRAEGRWRWDTAAIRSHEVGESAAEFLVSKLGDTPLETQRALQHAACIGSSFDLHTLLAADDREADARAAARLVDTLWPALEASLIVSLDDTYKLLSVEDLSDDEAEIAISALQAKFRFQHDRVQLAALTALGTEETQRVHLRIGHALLAAVGADDSRVFEIADHLNLARPLIGAADERLELARLDLEAGRRAKAATAFEASREYLRIATELVQDDWAANWRTEHSLMFELHLEAAEATYLCGDFTDAERLVDIALTHARSPLDTARAHETRIQLLRLQNRMTEAVETGLAALEALGIDLPHEPPSGLENADIEALPEMQDPSDLTALRVLHKTFTAAYFVRPALVPALNFAMLRLCLRGGTSPFVSLPCYLHGFYLAGFGEDVEGGYAYGQLARRLAARAGAEHYRPRVEGSFHGMLHHWKHPPREALEPLRGAIAGCLANGDIEYAGYCVLYLFQTLLWAAEPLPAVHEEQLRYLETLERLGLELQLDNARIWAQYTSSLLGRGSSHQLTGSHFDESTSIPAWRARGNANSLVTSFMAGTMLGCWFGDVAYAVSHADDAVPYRAFVNGLMISAQFRLFHSLALLLDRPTASGHYPPDVIDAVSSNQAALERWSAHVPANFRHKHQLVEAELMRIAGNHERAAGLFQSAADGARAGGFAHEEALANELLARLWLDTGREDAGAERLHTARDGYRLWGAEAKVEQLERSHGRLLEP